MTSGELRKDPTTGHWVLVRPAGASGGPPAAGAPCPFCPGNEGMTPQEIVAYRPDGLPANGLGWQVRVFPDRNPYFRIEEELIREGVGMFDRISVRGGSEILVEDPDHWATLAAMDEEQIGRVLWMYRDRVVDLKRDPQIRNVVVTRRHKKPGARIHHPYSRILATPIVFDDVRTELVQAREYYAYKRRCVWCDAMREELQTRERLIRVTRHFVAFVPYAARAPFDLRIVPRHHACAYDDVQPDQVGDLARLLRELAGALAKSLGDPPVDLSLHTAPNLQAKVLQREWQTIAKDYHWHVELTAHTPGRTGIGGIAVNERPPEEAAAELREAGGWGEPATTQ